MVSQLSILIELRLVEVLAWCDICDFFCLVVRIRVRKNFLLGALAVRVVADVPLFLVRMENFVEKPTNLTWVGCSMLNYDKNVFAYVKYSTKIWGETKIFVPPIRIVENHCKKMARGLVQYLKYRKTPDY